MNTSVPMMRLLLRTERDVVQARQRARELAAEFGLDNQDQIRFATATSEIARNAFRYASGGEVAFSIVLVPRQSVEATVSDSGAGISNLDEILDGRYQSRTGLGMGIIGTKRLMDEFTIDTSPSGTKVRMAKHLPAHKGTWTEKAVHELNRDIRNRTPKSPYDEIEQQNQELLKTLQELRSRQEELELLNHELEDTNRGVVALYAELDERADYLRRASELKTKFLSNVSHEFRTPLNSIISLSRMLMDKTDGDLTSEQMKQIRYIESSATDLQDMVNDLLDLAKVEAGKIRIRPKTFQVHELFSALKGMLKPLLADNNSVSLNFEDASDLPQLRTDEGKLSQILRNLISNSLKFTPEGSVTVSAQMVDSQTVEFKVVDTGIGIAAEHHETIFKEFSQVENPLQERYRGTGLGLPLCRNLAMLLGGTIWLNSELGKGSEFFVRVPSVYLGEATASVGMDTLPAPEFQRAPVLILEDDPKSAHLVETYLRDSEFQPILASSIEQAEIWAARHSPAIIVAEVYFGDETSWSFVASCREKWPKLPWISTSVFDEAAAAASWGSDIFLQKPIGKEALLGELRRLTNVTGIRNILLVDDNEVARYILRGLLDIPWINTQEVSSGSQALKSIVESPPDGVILDLLMPDMSGFDILRGLRNKPSTASLPVLIYTSKVLTESEKAELESLNASVIRKEDVSSRLSVQPFLNWARSVGIAPEGVGLERND
jgi:signal transduction histidine kinase/DNA-binding response OmpR family regulator